MNKINYADEEKSDSNDEKILVVRIVPAVPCDYEYGGGDYNAEKFRNRMEEQKTVKGRN